MQISKSAIKGKLVALAILYAMLTGARCWNGDPGAKDSINDFAANFPQGEFAREGETGIRTTGGSEGFFERGTSTDGRYRFVRSWSENGDLAMVTCQDRTENIEYTIYCHDGLVDGREYTDSEDRQMVLRDVVHYGTDPGSFRVFCEVGSCKGWPFPFARSSFLFVGNFI